MSAAKFFRWAWTILAIAGLGFPIFLWGMLPWLTGKENLPGTGWIFLLIGAVGIVSLGMTVWSYRKTYD